MNPDQGFLLARRVRLEGWTVQSAARAAGCSDRTAYRWLRQYDGA